LQVGVVGGEFDSPPAAGTQALKNGQKMSGFGVTCTLGRSRLDCGNGSSRFELQRNGRWTIT
jgi:hypothetical protein